jgi:hypothetical protein
MNRSELQFADHGREHLASELFSLGYTPEEYAARYAHHWHCFSLHEVRYFDPVLDEWIARLGDILHQQNGAPSLKSLRLQYLSAEERDEIETQTARTFLIGK